MAKKSMIVDFDDSFTHNIACELDHLGFETLVINHQYLKKEDIKDIDYLVWGPGPGHVSEYSHITNLIHQSLHQKDYPVVGICLGHQLIWTVLGYGLKQLSSPLHGVQKQSGELNVNSSDQLVQVYHSWVVDIAPGENIVAGGRYWNCSFFDGQLMMTRSENICTYQFHPESVGTNYPKAFFQLSH